MRMFHWLRRGLATLGPRRAGRLRAAAAAPPAAGRQPGAVEGRRRRHDHLSVRHDPLAAGEYRLAHAGVRQGAGQVRQADRRNADRREEPAGDRGRAGPAWRIATACRRSSTASRRTSAPRLHAAIAKSEMPLAAFDRMETWAAAFTAAWHCSSRSSASRAPTGVESVLAQEPSPPPASRSASSKPTPSSSASSINCRKPRSASCSKARSKARRRCAANSTTCSSAWTQRRRRCDRQELQRGSARLARTAGCPARAAQRQLGGLGRTAHDPAGTRDGRGRRRPSRRRRVGAGHARAAWLSSHARPINRAGVNFSPRKLNSSVDYIVASSDIRGGSEWLRNRALTILGR